MPRLLGGAGAGARARRIAWGNIAPFVVTPSLLCAGTFNFSATLVSISLLVVIILVRYRRWKIHEHCTRTCVFLLWGAAVMFCIHLNIIVTVMGARKVYIEECMLVLTMLMMASYGVYLVRVESCSLPDQFRRSQRRHTKTKRLNEKCDANSNSLCDSACGEKPHSGVFLTNPHPHELASFGAQRRPASDPSSDSCTDSDYDFAPSPVDASVDRFYPELSPLGHDDYDSDACDAASDSSSSAFRGRSNTECSNCRVARPPRSSHCPTCKACFAVRDHHCIWLDACVGATNHRTFVFVLFMLIVDLLYSAHLSLTTICTPEMVANYFLVPVDCRWSYLDFPTALIYVVTLYSSLLAVFLILLLAQQLVLISMNTTYQEYVDAYNAGRVRFGGVWFSSPHREGIIDNWKAFLCNERGMRR